MTTEYPNVAMHEYPPAPSKVAAGLARGDDWYPFWLAEVRRRGFSLKQSILGSPVLLQESRGNEPLL